MTYEPSSDTLRDPVNKGQDSAAIDTVPAATERQSCTTARADGLEVSDDDSTPARTPNRHLPLARPRSIEAWWTNLLGVDPYFDQPFYVGFNVAGYELGLLPNADPGDGALVYWGVADVAEAVTESIAHGAAEHTPVAGVGDDIVTATVRTPQGAIVGFISNPHFSAT